MQCPACKKSVPEHKTVCNCGWKVTFKTTLTPPRRIGFVNDYSGTLTRDEKEQINFQLKEFSRETRTDVVIVVVNDCGNLTPEQYAYWLFRKWKLRRFLRTGFLILVSLKDHRIETEIGYGFEKVISEAETERLLDEVIVPHFKKGWIGSGLLHGIRVLNKLLYQKAGMAAQATHA